MVPGSQAWGQGTHTHIYLFVELLGSGAHGSVHAGAGWGWGKAGVFFLGLRLDVFPFETTKPMGPLQCRPRAARDTSLSGCSGSIVQWRVEQLLHVASGPVRSMFIVASGHEITRQSVTCLAGTSRQAFSQRPAGLQIKSQRAYIMRRPTFKGFGPGYGIYVQSPAGLSIMLATPFDSKHCFLMAAAKEECEAVTCSSAFLEICDICSAEHVHEHKLSGA